MQKLVQKFLARKFLKDRTTLIEQLFTQIVQKYFYNENFYHEIFCTNIKQITVYKEFKKLVQKECRKTHNNYLADSLNNFGGSKHLWSYIKSKKKDQTGIGSLHHNDEVYTDDQEKANILNQYFPLHFHC